MRSTRRRPGDLVAAVSLVVGLLLIAAGTVGWRHAQARVAFGDPGGGGATSTGAPTTAAAAPIPAVVPSGPSALTAAPVRLLIPSLRVSAQIEPVLVTDGVLAVPDDVSRVGWWSGSEPVGALAGTTVIDGHIDSAEEGLGALAEITRLRSGDTVLIDTDTSTTLTYRVYAAGVYPKVDGLPAEIFNDSGPPRLVLISCGGQFNHATHSYENNVAVFASLQA
ncbi:MAG: peptidase sortase [Pseudonocardiales bacterium]|nr:peptidase sortase [Pseudonocardiales bacterium]